MPYEMLTSLTLDVSDAWSSRYTLADDLGAEPQSRCAALPTSLAYEHAQCYLALLAYMFCAPRVGERGGLTAPYVGRILGWRGDCP